MKRPTIEARLFRLSGVNMTKVEVGNKTTKNSNKVLLGDSAPSFVPRKPTQKE